MEFKTILAIFKRWVWLLVLAAIIGGAVGYFVSNRQAPIFQASTRFIVVRPTQSTYYDSYYSNLDTQQLIQTYAQLLTSEALLSRASTELGFPVYAGQASASQIGDSQFVLLTVTHPDPQKAASIANALVKLLIDENESLQSVRYVTAEENLQSRISQAEVQIDLLQSEINQLSAAAVEDQKLQVKEQISLLEPEIANLESQIAQIEETEALNLTLNDAEQLMLSKLKIELSSLQSIFDSYQQIYTNLVVMGKPVEDGSDTASQLEQLKSTLSLYKQIYISSINSLETARLSRAQSMGTVVQMDTAYPPRAPISPRPMQTAMMAGAICLIVAAGLAFLIEYLDDTIKTSDDVEALLKLPVLGYVADLDLKGKRNGNEMSGLFVANQPRSPVSEAFRSLRTNLEFASVDNPLNTILITSAGAGEGKTTVSANLALILGQGGKKVLLMDADLRKPSVHRHFGLSNRAGLSDLLRGKMSVQDVIQDISVSTNVQVLSSGGLPPNPAELLGSERMSQILADLRRIYDLVIIDCSPMLVADSQILSSKVDGIIFVIRPGKTHAINAIKPVEQLNRIGVKVLGVVFNRIPRNRDYYYGGYNYYSPYMAGNDYHHSDGAFDQDGIKQPEEVQWHKQPAQEVQPGKLSSLSLWLRQKDKLSKDQTENPQDISEKLI